MFATSTPSSFRAAPCLLAAAALFSVAPATEAQIAYGLGQAKIDGMQQFLAQGAGGSPLPLNTRLLDQTTAALAGPFVLGGPGTPPFLFVGAQASGLLGNPLSGCVYDLFVEVENDLDYALQGTASAITLAISSISEHIIDLQVISDPHEGPQGDIDVYSQQDAGRVVFFEVPFQLDQPRTLQIRAGSLRIEEPIFYGANDVQGETTFGWAVHADFGADGVFDGPASKLFGSMAEGSCDESPAPTGPTTSHPVPAGAYVLRLYWNQGSRIDDSITCPPGGGTVTVDADARVTETGCFRLTAL